MLRHVVGGNTHTNRDPFCEQGNLGMGDHPFEHKIQFSKLSVRPSDANLTAEQRREIPENFKAVVLAEAIQTSNKTNDFTEFLGAFWEGTKLTMHKMFPNRQSEINSLCPLLVNTDCAGQLVNAILAVFSLTDQVSNQIMYANVFMTIYLRLDYLSGIDTKNTSAAENTEDPSDWAWRVCHKYCAIFIHLCRNHVIRSVKKWFRKSLVILSQTSHSLHFPI